jgi:hypothetical protein
MSITQLEYFKMILQKVSFDAILFEKELKKALKQLVKIDILALKKWCYEIFGKVYRKILKAVFSTIQFRKRKVVNLIG